MVVEIKIANIVLPVVDILLGTCGLLLLNNLHEKCVKIKLYIAIVLIAIGFIAIIGARVIEKYMWWTSWGW